MAGELWRVWEAVKADPEVVCAIVTGAGEKAFCTGMDVADVADGERTRSTRPPPAPGGALGPPDRRPEPAAGSP